MGGCAVGEPAPVIAIGGNADEPICTDERGALDRLGFIVDCFLLTGRRAGRRVARLGGNLGRWRFFTLA